MFCAISGEVPQEPVVSKNTGHVYEKKLISKYILDEGKCPVTGQPLSEEDLISIQVNKAVRPRPTTTTSIPGLLAMFQNEWDEIMLETFTLKQQLDLTRQELSQALYQNDAACRVIARLMKERDEARMALTNIQTTTSNMILPSSSSLPIKNGQNHLPTVSKSGQETNGQPTKDTSEKMDIETDTSSTDKSSVISVDVIDKINAKCKELSTNRRSRKPQPEGVLSKESMNKLHEISHTTTLHKTNSILCMALSNTSTDNIGQYTLSGSQDKTAILSDRTKHTSIAKLSGHTKKVISVAFHPIDGHIGPLFTGSADNAVKMWEKSGNKYKDTHTLTHHKSHVTGLSVHPTGDYLVSTSLDGTWSFLDIATGGTCLKQIPIESDVSISGTGIVSGQFHPDGLIFGTNISTHITVVEDNEHHDVLSIQTASTSQHALKIWDIREQTNVATFSDHTNILTGLSFSENGYYVSTGSMDGTARIWDLRKLKCVKVLEFGIPVTSVAFDYSGLYLSIASGVHESTISTYNVKEWSEVSKLSNVHKSNITGLHWSRDSSTLVSSSLDHVIRVYGHE